MSVQGLILAFLILLDESLYGRVYLIEPSEFRTLISSAYSVKK